MSDRFVSTLCRIVIPVFAALLVLPARAGESAMARDALDRAVRFMGGEAVVYGMRTLVVTTDSTREIEGKPIAVPAKTYYAFPMSVRHEIVVNGRTIAMASTPTAGGTMFTEDGPALLNEADRVGVERATMRNPVVLLKSRLGRGFVAEHAGREALDGHDADLVRLLQQGNETVMAIDRNDGRLLELRYVLKDRDLRSRSLAVRLSDWRAAPGGVVYPHVARGRENGSPVFEVTTRTVEVDAALSDELFSAGMSEAGVGIRFVR